MTDGERHVRDATELADSGRRVIRRIPRRPPADLDSGSISRMHSDELTGRNGAHVVAAVSEQERFRHVDNFGTDSNVFEWCNGNSSTRDSASTMKARRASAGEREAHALSPRDARNECQPFRIPAPLKIAAATTATVATTTSHCSKARAPDPPPRVHMDPTSSPSTREKSGTRDPPLGPSSALHLYLPTILEDVF